MPGSLPCHEFPVRIPPKRSMLYLTIFNIRMMSERFTVVISPEGDMGSRIHFDMYIKVG